MIDDFEDMAIYSFVKKIIPLTVLACQSLYLMDEQGDCSLVKAFGYQDFKGDYHDERSKIDYRMPAEYESPSRHPRSMADSTRFMAFGKAAKEHLARLSRP